MEHAASKSGKGAKRFSAASPFRVMRGSVSNEAAKRCMPRWQAIELAILAAAAGG
jgi:hypothetical protein